MGAQSIVHRFEYFGEVLVLHVEHDQRGLAVPPRKVAHQLVKCSCHTRWSHPQLTFRYESGAVILLNADVRLALASKYLAHRVALKVAIQLGKDDISKILLAMHSKSAGGFARKCGLGVG